MTRAGPNIHEVIEPAVIVERVRPKIAQCGGHARASLLWCNPSVMSADAQRGQAKASGSDTTDRAVACSVIAGAIEYDAGVRIGLLPEIEEASFGVILQEEAFIGL